MNEICIASTRFCLKNIDNVDLWGENISDTGAKIIAQGLQKASKLTELNLGIKSNLNHFSTIFFIVHELCKIIKIGFCSIGESGMAALGIALQGHQSLRKLILGMILLIYFAK